MKTLACILMLFTIVHAEDSSEFKKLDKAAKKVKVYRKSDPPEGCAEMGEIKSPDIKSLDKLTHEKMLQREAVGKGANAIQILDGYNEGVTAVMFKCKVGK